MQLLTRIRSAAPLAALLALTACASTPPPATKGATPQKSGGDVNIHVSDSLFEVPSNKSAKSVWIAYGGFRLLWEDKNYSGKPEQYHETPEETLASMDFLAEIWAKDQDHKPGEETYLDTIVAVQQAGYLKEYVWDCMARQSWSTPPTDLRHQQFADWMLAHATNFSVYETAVRMYDGKQVSVGVHEPVAITYCLPHDATAPKPFTIADADAKVEAAGRLMQQGGSEQVTALLDQAIAVYDAALAKQAGTPRCLDNIAEYYGHHNQHPEEQVLLVDPDYCAALHLQGYLKSGDHDWEAARAILQREHELSPYSPGAVTELGFVAQGSSGPAAAVPIYWSALGLAEAEMEHKSEMTGILRRLGESYIDLKKYDEARSALDAALSTDPNDAGTKRELQYLEQVSGKH